MSPFSIRASLALVFALGSYVAAETLPECAKTCVSTTRTKCKATDFACACTDEKYIPNLIYCIQNLCEEDPAKQAYSFLEDLCNAADAPIHRILPATLRVEVERIEVRTAAPASPPSAAPVHGGQPIRLIERQVLSSFIPASDFSAASATATRTSLISGIPSLVSSVSGASGASRSSSVSRSITTIPSSSTAGPTSTGSGGNGGNGGGGGSGGLSTAAKIGIGLGVPLGVIVLGGLVGLAFWLGRRQRNRPDTSTQQNTTAEMAQDGTGNAELSGAAYQRHELPTKGNTAELPSKPGQDAGYDYAQQDRPYEQSQVGSPDQHYGSPNTYPQNNEPAELPERSTSGRR